MEENVYKISNWLPRAVDGWKAITWTRAQFWDSVSRAGRGRRERYSGPVSPPPRSPEPPALSPLLWHCTQLWDRRRRASRLPASAETASLCRPLPELRRQGPWGQQPGPFLNIWRHVSAVVWHRFIARFGVWRAAWGDPALVSRRSGPVPPTVSCGSGRCGSTDEPGAGLCDLWGCVPVLLLGEVGAARGSSETPGPWCDAGELCTCVIAGTCGFQVSRSYSSAAGREPGVSEEVATTPVIAEKTWRRPGLVVGLEQQVSWPQMRTPQAEPSIHTAHPCNTCVERQSWKTVWPGWAAGNSQQVNHGERLTV